MALHVKHNDRATPLDRAMAELGRVKKQPKPKVDWFDYVGGIFVSQGIALVLYGLWPVDHPIFWGAAMTVAGGLLFFFHQLIKHIKGAKK